MIPEMVIAAAELRGWKHVDVDPAGPSYDLVRENGVTSLEFYNVTSRDVDEVVTEANEAFGA